jgi:transcription-repair coupling factor (superfamily II helicase)
VPEARIAVAHGQMTERTLEKVMQDFYHQRFNVLVCSTIIETGIDIPTANTILIERADKLGLAQLHQLRGRVGRSHHQAYAYCLTPTHTLMSKDALKRLEALEMHEELGAGFNIAAHDLEIRGAGELLGESQSGHIEAIGYSLYMELLENTVTALKTGKKEDWMKPLYTGPEINCQTPALIPEGYIGDIQARLILYKRIAGTKSAEELDELQVEMIDRFGLLPEPTQTLFRLTKLKQRLVPLVIQKIELGPEGGFIEFAANTTVDPKKLIALIQVAPTHYKLRPNRLNITKPLLTFEARWLEITTLIGKLM